MKLFLTLILAVAPILAFSQEPNASPAQPLSSSEVISWEQQMAQSAFELNPSIENRAELVHVLERLTQVSCMYELPKLLVYVGGSEEIECLKAVRSLLDLQQNNPVAICARDGIDAGTCQQAYKEQVVEAGNFEAPARLAQLSNDLEQALSRYQQSSSTPADTLNFRRAAHKSLTEICRKTGLRLEANSSELNIDSPVDQAPNFKRTRLVSRECLSATDKVQSVDPNGPVAICFRDGGFTPSCTKARRRERDEMRVQAGANKPNAQSKPDQGAGFSEF